MVKKSHSFGWLLEGGILIMAGDISANPEIQ
jgi:hypothetical protein